MKLAFKIIITLSVLGHSLKAQVGVGGWELHVPFSESIAVAASENKVYSAAKSGIFSVNLNDNSIDVISKVNGLSDVGITAMSFEAESGTMLIGYQNGNIDLIRNNVITNLPDLKRSFIQADKQDRTGTGTRSIFGHQMRFNLNDGFPCVTTKKLHLRSIIHELLWFLKGDTNIQYLKENKVKIWDEWADENGDLGPVYGSQWRSWPCPDGKHIDQIQNVIQQIQNNPDSRRLIVSAWNVAEVENMALPPCHMFFQFYVANGKLSCQLYQRSADIFLGVPFNIASYALLNMMVAQVCNLKVGDFVHTFGDAHLYSNHFEQAKLQLSRTPRELPTMKINPEIKNIFDFKYENFKLLNYQPHPHIKAPVAV